MGVSIWLERLRLGAMATFSAGALVCVGVVIALALLGRARRTALWILARRALRSKAQVRSDNCYGSDDEEAPIVNAKDKAQ